MVRASTTGAIDFSQFDPDDTWWWRRLRWVLREVASQQRIAYTTLRHHHSVGVLSAGVDRDSWDRASGAAHDALQTLADEYFPWLADEKKATTSIDPREKLVAQYREQYGKPGEARYELAIKENLKMWRHPPSAEEKMRRRRERRKQT